MTTNAEGVLTYTVGSGAGNVFTFSAPAVQYVNIQDAEREGILTRPIDLMFNRSVDAGEDELSLAFT